MVIFYSRSGHTRVFAQVLQGIRGGELHELTCDLNSSGSFSFVVKALMLTLGDKAYPCATPASVPGEIYVCSPVWGGNVAAPVKHFLRSADLSSTTVNVILTASTPVEKYCEKVRKMLATLDCRIGNVHIFATDDKAKSDPEIIREHLEELL
jgi:hypothetical protein